MAAQTEIRATADADLTARAAAILAAAGYTLADAVRILLTRTVEEQALPFDTLVPNRTTVQAMGAARRGDLVKVGSLSELLIDLHADD